MNEYLIYSGGKFIRTEQRIDVSCSFDDKVFAYTYLASKENLEHSILMAQQAFVELKKMPSYKLERILLEIAQKLKDNRKRLAEVLALEACKPIVYALSEIDRAAQTFKVAAQEALRPPGEYMSIDWTPAGENKEAWIKYFPVGPVSGISPFNFPMNLIAHKVAPAIAARCPIVVKPASSTPLSTLELARIIDETELPKGAFSVLPASREVGNLLVTDERFKLLTFTGSPEVGWKMKNDAGKKKVVLELGGNAAAIITPTANIKEALKKCLVGAFAYAGQVCIHTQRIYVHHSIFDTFLTDFVQETKKLKLGNPLESSTDISAVIDEKNAIRIETWIFEAQKQGAKILCGGKRHGNIIEPTVITGTDKSMKVNGEEVFGPTVVIEPYSDFEEALRMTNDTPYGLQAGVFTNQLDEMNQAFELLEFGGVMINEAPSYRVDHMPYGGIKDSGLGREGLKYAIFDMLEPRIMVKPK
jgi:acyl-CoA reductase-like NAD-dependent aldehyde dehydrogenase